MPLCYCVYTKFFHAALILHQSTEVLQERVREIEVMLGMVLRLPEGSGKKARLEAFKGAVDSMIENAEQRGQSGFKEVDSRYLQVGVYVCVRARFRARASSSCLSHLNRRGLPFPPNFELQLENRAALNFCRSCVKVLLCALNSLQSFT
jgi:hypothetical protein